MKTPFELEIVNDNDDNDNGDKVCAMYYPRKSWMIFTDSIDDISKKLLFF